MTPHLHTLKSISFSNACTQSNTFFCQKHLSCVKVPCIPPRRTLTSAVSEAVQDVALVAQALEAARVVDAGVVTGSLEGALVNV